MTRQNFLERKKKSYKQRDSAVYLLHMKRMRVLHAAYIDRTGFQCLVSRLAQ